MEKEGLLNYVRAQLQKGYDAKSIKKVLLSCGYADYDISQALNSAHGAYHSSHFAKMLFFVGLLILFASGSLIYFYFSQESQIGKPVSIQLKLLNEAKPGEELYFIADAINFDGKSQLPLEHQLIDSKSFKVISSIKENHGQSQSKIAVPNGIPPGNYILRTIASHNGKRIIATMQVKISPAAAAATCFDSILNQNEEDVDCGGICRPCPEKAQEVKNYCGDGICGENEQGCDADCKKPAAFFEPVSETIEQIKEIAASRPQDAMQKCSQIELQNSKDNCIAAVGEVQKDPSYCTRISDSRIKDSCHLKIAEATNSSALCEQISTSGRKDACYMTFILDSNDFTLCAKVSHETLRQSCDLRRQLAEQLKSQK